MHKNFILVLVLFFIVGCGSQVAEKKYEGVESGEDYIAEGMTQLTGTNPNVQEAIKKFDMAIKQDPTNVNNYMVLGQVYMRLQNYDRAIDSLSAAVRVDPSSGEAFYLLSLSQNLKGDRDEAVGSAKKSAEIFMQKKDAEKLKQSLALVKTLTEEIAKPADVNLETFDLQ